MIDYDQILDTYISIAQEGVGSLLSSVGPPSAPEPAVIKARKEGTAPDYPYIKVDIVATEHTSGWMLDSGIVDVMGTPTPYIDTHYKLLLQYTIYGGNANSIAHSLESYFRLDRVLNKVEIGTTGSVESTTNVMSIPEKQATDFVEAASFNIIFNICDRYLDSDEGTGVFDTIQINGELKSNEDDPENLPITVNETSGVLP